MRPKAGIGKRAGQANGSDESVGKSGFFCLLKMGGVRQRMASLTQSRNITVPPAWANAVANLRKGPTAIKV